MGKAWSVRTVERSSAMKWHGAWAQAIAARAVQSSQRRGPHDVRFHGHKISRTGKATETESELVVAGPAVAGGGWGVTANGYRVAFGVIQIFWD